jgi:hypothetical protein
VVNVPGQQMNIGTVTANSIDEPGGESLSRDDPAFYFVERIKFFVPDKDDDATYRYTESGRSIDDFALQGDNSDPRGATALADESTVWVLDKDRNENVYVYDREGVVFGAWQARKTWAENSNMSDKVEGIATDGTDIWIVDKDKDVVFFYSGGASFTAGSHNATSKFDLHAKNNEARGITTDGVHLWVVEEEGGSDGGTDRVYKYTVGGNYLGRWRVDSSITRPRGITIDPAGGDSIWIVDEESEKIYQYDNATGQTNGFRSADFTYDLNPENDKPQGIADPRPFQRGRVYSPEDFLPQIEAALVVDQAQRPSATDVTPFVPLAGLDGYHAPWVNYTSPAQYESPAPPAEKTVFLDAGLLAAVEPGRDWAGVVNEWDALDADEVDSDRETSLDKAFELFGDEEWQISNFGD